MVAVIAVGASALLTALKQGRQPRGAASEADGFSSGSFHVRHRAASWPSAGRLRRCTHKIDGQIGLHARWSPQHERRNQRHHEQAEMTRHGPGPFVPRAPCGLFACEPVPPLQHTGRVRIPARGRRTRSAPPPSFNAHARSNMIGGAYVHLLLRPGRSTGWIVTRRSTSQCLPGPAWRNCSDS